MRRDSRHQERPGLDQGRHNPSGTATPGGRGSAALLAGARKPHLEDSRASGVPAPQLLQNTSGSIPDAAPSAPRKSNPKVASGNEERPTRIQALKPPLWCF